MREDFSHTERVILGFAKATLRQYKQQGAKLDSREWAAVPTPEDYAALSKRLRVKSASDAHRAFFRKMFYTLAGC